MSKDVCAIIHDHLGKFLKMEMNDETLHLITLEINHVVGSVYPQFSAINYIEPFFLKDERKLKFRLHRIH